MGMILQVDRARLRHGIPEGHHETIVTEANSPRALPSRVVMAAFPEVEITTPALAMMVPAMVPPPALLMTASLPTCQ